MNFQEYQNESVTTDLMPGNTNYHIISMVSEAGEVSGKWSKVLRDNGGIMPENFKDEIKKEAGDVLWHLTQVATSLGLTLEEIAIANIEKLQSRKERGVIQGSGDNR